MRRVVLYQGVLEDQSLKFTVGNYNGEVGYLGDHRLRLRVMRTVEIA